VIIKKSYLSFVGALGFVAMLTISACGGAAPQQSSAATPTAQANAAQAQQTPVSPLPTNVPAGEAKGEAGGVETAFVTYTDAAQHFSVGHPGSWTQDPSAKDTLKFNGGDSSLALTFVTLAAGKDAMAYASGDVATATAQYPGFKQVGLAPSTEVQGAIVLGFEASGKSAVTGKAFTARGDRYYIPMSDGRLAVFTVVGPTQNYDREGVRDLALTLKSLK
jgi:hypothetical protein